ncbi:hypothetical protein C8Q80DRAFT_1264789 [Daedaleopsis nitida]|nr:hypothetical protein C8Q80DRAFT_1264789 [Daedaleopsis nitida]
MPDSDKPLVLILGAAGFTGGSIVDGLLAAGSFRVGAMIRPTSLTSLTEPDLEKLCALNVKIRVEDGSDGVEKLNL